MTKLPPNQQLVGSEKWPVVGERAPRDDSSPWNISVVGCVNSAVSWTLDELREFPIVEREIDVHCVTRWSRLAMPFTGIPLKSLLEVAGVGTSARFISFVARSERGHSTSLSLDYLSYIEPLVALTADGKPIPTEHGGPVRMVVPGRYFYKSVKWLETIEVLAEDLLGYWEADIGYHNSADPWKEERFIAGNISKPEALKLIENRCFDGLDLRSIDCSNRQLDQLSAKAAALRNADFRGASLREANFDDANLSGARFANCDLTGATFRRADIEGADFSGAVLKHVDLSGASLFGASFCVFEDGPKRAAIFDEQTKFDPESLDALTDDQRQFVQSHLGQ
ncbi:MAG: molybdopterin-dependent oxidoreductase [Planctomycetaceae bacterium]